MKKRKKSLSVLTGILKPFPELGLCKGRSDVAGRPFNLLRINNLQIPGLGLARPQVLISQAFKNILK
jgi:hypothetical protein